MLMLGLLAACGASASDDAATTDKAETKVEAETQTESIAQDETETNPSGSIITNLEKIDMSKWMYESDDNVYYQIGISYCEVPADASYENLAIFVPGDYFSGTDNGDGTYICEINLDAAVNGYTAETAPIVMPIETPGYSAQYKVSVMLYTARWTGARLPTWTAQMKHTNG